MTFTAQELIVLQASDIVTDDDETPREKRLRSVTECNERRRIAMGDEAWFVYKRAVNAKSRNKLRNALANS